MACIFRFMGSAQRDAKMGNQMNTNISAYKVKVVSACKTYRETIGCRSMEEAQAYAEAIRENGDTATIIAPKQ